MRHQGVELIKVFKGSALHFHFNQLTFGGESSPLEKQGLAVHWQNTIFQFHVDLSVERRADCLDLAFVVLLRSERLQQEHPIS